MSLNIYYFAFEYTLLEKLQQTRILLDSLNKLVGRNKALLASSHILESKLAFGNLRLAHKSHIRHLLGIGISHLLLHLNAVGEYLCAYACSTTLSKYRQAISHFLLAKIDEEKLGSVDSLLWIKVKTVEHIVDAVGTKRNAHATKTRKA